MDFTLFRRPTFRIHYLALCPKCAKSTEYIANLRQFPCGFCNPTCRKFGQMAKQYARVFVPAKKKEEPNA